MPLSNAPYLRQSFVEILKMSTPDKQVRRLVQLAYWEDAGEGGFYDDLGDVGASPHFVHHAVHDQVSIGNTTGSIGATTSNQTGDQAIVQYPIAEIKTPSDQHYEGAPLHSSDQWSGPHPGGLAPPMVTNETRRSQLNSVRTVPILPARYSGDDAARVQVPIQLRYNGLPAGAVYNVSVTGPTKNLISFNLSANGQIIWSPSDESTSHFPTNGGRVAVSMDDKKVLHWSIPAHITQQGGDLLLAWGSSCCKVELTEVWLRRVG
jgi:hypothetical protein